MARNGSGVYSLPSPQNPVITKQTITTDWANSTLQDIGNEIQQSLDRNGKGDMLAPVRPPAGLASAPSHTFSTDPDTGLYSSAANGLGFATGGTMRATLDSTSLTIAAALRAGAGNVGAPGLSFSGDTDSGLYLNAAGDIRMAIGGVDLMSFQTNIGISAATAATGGTRQDALALNNGDLNMAGVAYPTKTTAIANRLTPANMVKAWAVVSLSGAATFVPSFDDGFNVATVERVTANLFKITWASAFANANYGVIGLHMTGGCFLVNVDSSGSANRLAGSCGFGLLDTTAGGAHTLDADAVVKKIMIVAFGAQ